MLLSVSPVVSNCSSEDLVYSPATCSFFLAHSDNNSSRVLSYYFLLCSYNKDLLDKVMEMADGIEVEDLPQFTTRGTDS